MNHALLQARIVHLTDLHFGKGHRFSGAMTAAGTPAASKGIPTLAESIGKDLQSAAFAGSIWHGDGQHRNPLLLALTGDLTQTGSVAELKQAEQCVRDLCTGGLLSTKVVPSEVAIVPGNHDVLYDRADPSERWSLYCPFDARLRGTSASPDDATRLTRVVNRSAEGLVVAELNSCFYVVKDSPETHRGQIDEASLDSLDAQLEAIPAAERRDSLKIALVHHHPVVLPFFAEAGRGYDAIVGATKLLQLLRKHEFHLVLHGHKHFPHTFSYDPQCAWTAEQPHGLLIVAGGSAGAGASELPADEKGATNTYNAIALKWNPALKHGRVRIITRGLVVHDEDGHALTAPKWHWKTLKVADRLLGPQRLVTPTEMNFRAFAEADGPLDEQRRREYARLRGNMPVVDVRPSLDPGQAYQVTAYVEEFPHTPIERPVMVEWSAGPKFGGIQRCTKVPFAAQFSYWGPVNLQMRLHFADGSVETHTVYARTS